MSYTRSVDTRMWGDRKFCSVSKPQPNAQTLFFYLLTGPETGILPGVFRMGRAALAEALGWDVDATVRCFDELVELGMAIADWLHRIVYLPNALRYGPAVGPDWVKKWGEPFDQLPDCDLKVEVYRRFLNHFQALAAENPRQKPTLQAFYEAVPPPDQGTPPGLAPGHPPTPPPQKDQDQDQRSSSSARDQPGGGEVLESPTPPPPQEPVRTACAVAGEVAGEEVGKVIPIRDAPPLNPREHLWARIQNQRADVRCLPPEGIHRTTDRKTGEDTLEELRVLYGDDLVVEMHLSYLATDEVTVDGRKVRLERAKPGWAWDLFKRNADKYFIPKGQAPAPVGAQVVGEVRNAF